MNNANIDKSKATLIGHTRMGKPVYCADDARHVIVCGTNGSGKTVELFNHIESAVKKNYGLLLVDGKGDTGKGSMLEAAIAFCEKYKRPLYVVNMNDPARSARFNPFRGATETVAKDMLVNMTDWSEEHYKTNAERYIQRLVKLLNIAAVPLSFHSIIKHMAIDKFMDLSAALQKRGLITKENHLENLELIKASGKIAEQAAARFATIAESEVGQIFSEDGIDIYTALESGTVILFILNPLLFPETSAVMGRLVLIDAKKAVSKLFGKNKRSFFVMDEINVYASPVLVDLINKSRSAGVTCISAMQSLADLEAAAGTAFKSQIIENSNNYVVLRQNSFASAEEWAMTLGTYEKMEMTWKTSDLGANGEGSARMVRAFHVHPDEIKAFKTGEGVFLSRDTGKCERIRIIKPF